MQLNVGSLAVTAIDRQGTVIPGATIDLTGASGPRQAVTDENGIARFPDLVPAEYGATAQLAGFAPAQANAQVHPGRQATLQLVLVPAVHEAILVSD